MSKTRDPYLPQHDYDQGHYGELPLNSLPNGTTGDIFYFEGTDWTVQQLSGLASNGPFEPATLFPEWRLKSGTNLLFSTDQTAYVYMSPGFVEIGDGTGGLWFDGTKGIFYSNAGIVEPIVYADPISGDSEDGQRYYNGATHRFRGRVSGSWQTFTTDDRNLSSAAIAIDNGASVITTGIKTDIPIFFNCQIVGVELLANISGSFVLDIWKNTYANYPPTVADTITAGAKPTLSGIKYLDTTLTGWTTTINAGDTLRFNVDSASTVNRVTCALKLQRT